MVRFTCVHETIISFTTKDTKHTEKIFGSGSVISVISVVRNRGFTWRFGAKFGFHDRALCACLTLDFPFGHTTGANPSFRLSARSLRATRPNARWAGATNAGCFLTRFVLRSFVILQSRAGLNVHHLSWKSLSVSPEGPGCPKWPIGQRAVDNDRPDE